MQNTRCLYTTEDVKEVREYLLTEQEKKDILTKLEIPKGQAVLDHDHKTMYVRGVLHRQSNATLGKVENLWIRYLGWWYPYDLPKFLEQCAEYLRREGDLRYVHPAWLKRVKTDFNKLNSKQQDLVLEFLCNETGTNSTQRKNLFSVLLLTRCFSFDMIAELLQLASQEHQPKERKEDAN